MNKLQSRVDVALIHHPVCNRQGETIGSAVTNLDIHDIARACRTFGVDQYFIATPYEDQQILVRELLEHWLTGAGGVKNPDRKSALSLVRVVASVGELIRLSQEKWGVRPHVLATCARPRENTISYGEARDLIEDGTPCLILFGTASGLAAEIFELVEMTLPPIAGGRDYNHLSVRSAVSIVLDRLLAKEFVVNVGES